MKFSFAFMSGFFTAITFLAWVNDYKLSDVVWLCVFSLLFAVFYIFGNNR